MLNLIIWLIVLFITITWTVGVVFKPKKMGGEQSWGPVNFKISILWWISIIFVFITGLLFSIIVNFEFLLDAITFLLLIPMLMIMKTDRVGNPEIDEHGKMKGGFAGPGKSFPISSP